MTNALSNCQNVFHLLNFSQMEEKIYLIEEILVFTYPKIWIPAFMVSMSPCHIDVVV